MKLKRTILPIIILGSLLIAGCAKQDEFMDWKRINDEWFDANKTRTESFPFEWSIDILKTPFITADFETTESGVKYKPLRLGNPTDKKVNPTSRIVVTYEGKLIDGTSFDKATEKDLGAVGGSVTGFRDVLLKMHIGDIYEFYIPQEQGYGDQQSGKIPPYSALTFRVELIDAIN